MSLLKSLTSFTVSSSSSSASNQNETNTGSNILLFDNSSVQSKLNYYNKIYFIGVRVNK